MVVKETATQRVQLRLTASERERLQALASAAGETVTGWVRLQIAAGSEKRRPRSKNTDRGRQSTRS